MIRVAPISLSLLLAGCGTASDRAADPPTPTEPAVQILTPVGLYQAGAGGAPSQLCIADQGGGDIRFGLVVRAAGGGACSGAGSAAGQSGLLRLEMAGDESCTIEAAVQGRRVVFPAALPPGCAYYCGAGAAMAGAEFEKIGGTSQDALRARDLVGDPLCDAPETP